jgi:molecular chaperone GrpE
MTDPNDDDSLLIRLEGWLRLTRAVAEAEALGDEARPAPEADPPGFGLYRLVEEFTALRHEVKLQTKGARDLREQAEALLPALGRAVEEFRSVGPKEDQAAYAAARPLAEALADLDEALDRGRAEAEKARRGADGRPGGLAARLDALYAGEPWFRRLWLRPYHERARSLAARDDAAPLLDALLAGYDLIRERLRRTMAAEGLRRVEAPGRPVDPGLMTVVGLVDAPGHPPGLVVDEVRRGYTWRGRVLRYAEVRAARPAAAAPGGDRVTATDGTMS